MEGIVRFTATMSLILQALHLLKVKDEKLHDPQLRFLRLVDDLNSYSRGYTNVSIVQHVFVKAEYLSQ